MPETGGGVIFSPVFLDKTPPNDPHIDEMMQWGKKFFTSGAVRGIEGNLSFRTKLGFIITGTGVALNNIAKDNIAEVRGVVFGLNRPSVYIKGLVVPSMETLLHSGIYEALPEINAIFHTHENAVLKIADKLGILSTGTERPAGSAELAQEAVDLVRLNNSVRYFLLRNHGVIALGATMAEAGAVMAEMQGKAKSGKLNSINRKKRLYNVKLN